MCTDVQQKSTSAQRIGELWLDLIVGNIVCDLCFTYTVDVIVAILAENCNTDITFRFTSECDSFTYWRWLKYHVSYKQIHSFISIPNKIKNESIILCRVFGSHLLP